MCLLSKYREPFVAKQDIECYKQISVGRKNNGKIIFLTPYWCTDVTNEVRNTKVLKPKFWSRVQAKLDYYFKFKKNQVEYEINGGYIHSYMPCRFCNVDYMRCEGFKNSEIYLKCIIPAGSLYYKDSCCGTYASEKLVITESDENINHFLDVIFAVPAFKSVKPTRATKRKNHLRKRKHRRR